MIHVAQGMDPDTGRLRVAKGVIAVGNLAVGVLAIGGIAIGGLALGGMGPGVLAIGGIAAGGAVLAGWRSRCTSRSEASRCRGYMRSAG